MENLTEKLICITPAEKLEKLIRGGSCVYPIDQEHVLGFENNLISKAEKALGRTLPRPRSLAIVLYPEQMELSINQDLCIGLPYHFFSFGNFARALAWLEELSHG